ncbi:methenyltetrahydrofolate synthase domain-containing protein [Venturia canescens]|uniref:methenyltetrahydrofolate synthase domain-containing protein n=1 Tax=Venturia canescens TaxID=32260 RepID=UPI001C9C5912|nr:methenyltetrahydrofolate synthase domain-containing protein [Venturia canescens]
MPDEQEIRACDNSDDISTTTEKDVSKQAFRKKIWDHIKKNELADSQLSLYSRIPNFEGAEEAAQRILQLDEFKRAKVIKINLDKPQEHVRLLALEANKEILVPIPRLKSGIFLHVVPDPNTSKEDLKQMVAKRDLQEFSKTIGLDSNIKVDLVVLGSVCVSRTGRRIGKGEGFADLEFGVLMKMGAVSSETTIVTTVHDCQIVDSLPDSLFEKYDVPVDVIVTPTQTLRVSERLKRPEGIYWEMLTQRRVKSMEILQQLQQKDEKDGKTVTLKEKDTSDERRRYERRWFEKPRSKRRPRVKGEVTDSKGATMVETDEKSVKEHNNRGNRRGRLSERRHLRDRKVVDGDSEAAPVTENEVSKIENETKPRRRKPMRPRTRADIDFSLKLSNIKSDVRVRHLKNALLERGIRARHITWHGQRGYCYLHFGKLRNKDSKPDQPVQVDSIVANLQHLKLGDTVPTDSANETNENEYIVVEPAKPITRIEITDVTAV